MSEEEEPLVRSAELWDLLGRYSWMLTAWHELPEESRHKYDEWVLSSRTSGAAKRRAQVVARRCYTGRPWTGSRTRRIGQGLRDYFNEAPETPQGDAGTMGT